MILALDGILAGAAHVFTGPDHLVGVAPLAVERRPEIRPAVVGASWGLGHGVGVAVLGILGQTLLTAAQVDIASVWAERLVGLVLVVLGLVAIRRSRGLVVHQHVHTHGGEPHSHLHVHGTEHDHTHRDAHGDPTRAHARAHRHGHTAFGVGIVHGLAGGGHFWAVLPSLAMSPPQAATYIAAYIGASVVAMVLFGAALGRASRSLGTAWVPRFIASVGVLTIAVGVWWTSVAFGWL